MDNLYTPEVEKHMYHMKQRLPADFPLVTRCDGPYIIIQIPMRDYAWRTVEDREQIALNLLRLKELIEGTGIGCLLEKV